MKYNSQLAFNIQAEKAGAQIPIIITKIARSDF